MLPHINRILYTTALTQGAPHVFRYALALARRHQAQISVLHILEPLSPFAQSLVELHVAHERSEKMHAEAREQVKVTIEQRLEELCKAEECQDDTGCDLVSDITVLEGQPAEKILEYAGEIDADLIIVGCSRQSVLGEALIGSTANKVLHRSDRPVLLVKKP